MTLATRLSSSPGRVTTALPSFVIVTLNFLGASGACAGVASC